MLEQVSFRPPAPNNPVIIPAKKPIIIFLTINLAPLLKVFEFSIYNKIFFIQFFTYIFTKKYKYDIFIVNYNNK